MTEHSLVRTVRVVLYGRLRKRFGREYQIGASTCAHAVQILCTLIPGFREEVTRGHYRIIRGPRTRGFALDPLALHLRVPPDGQLHIIPAAAGGKNAGPAKIILGVVLVAAAFVLPELAGAYFGTAGLGGTAVAAGGSIAGGSIAVAGSIGGVSVLGSLALFGGAMIIGGLASVLATSMQTPKPLGNSFLLSGALNVASEGGPVPVIYGRMRVGSVVVSIGYEAAAYVGQGTIPGSQAPDGSSGYSGDLGYLGTGRGGSGKSGSGPGGSGFEEPNTLRSNATVRIIDLLSEGPIGGLVGGAQGIFFNDTPLLGSDGVHWNFHGVSWTLRLGLPDQDPVPGYAASEEIIAVQMTVASGTPIIRTFESTTATAARVTVQIPALYEVHINNGDMNQTDIQYTISMRPSKAGTGGFIGAWVDVVQENLISQKCTSPFEISYRIPLLSLDLGANTWDIQVTKITQDSLVSTTQNTLIFENVTMITDHQLMYPDSAYIALTFDAKAFNSAIPTRSYLIDGRTISVPANYDPVSGSYASSGPGTTGGTWDAATFKQAVSSNPAWCLYDMVNHQRYGCDISSQFLEIARADLYVIAQYCDGLVPDGFGGAERRYQVNAVIADQTDAFTLVQTMASAFRGMTYWGAGQIRVSNDMPKNPVKLVNQANVKDGLFDYQGTSRKTRHNLVRAMWRDPGNRYSPTPEGVEITADIANRGQVAADIVAWGCTSRGLAHRWAKWLLFSENQQTEVVQYDAGLYHMDLRPGEIFQLQDPAYFGTRWAGRLRTGSTAGVLLLDGLVDLGTSTSFTVTVVMPDNTVAHQALTLPNFSIAASGDDQYTVISFLPPFSQTPLPQVEWILADNDLPPRLFQTVQMTAGDPGWFTVNAAEYNPAKFDYVEFGIAFQPQIFSKLPALLLAALTPPSNVSAVDYLVGNGVTTIIRLTVSWTPVVSDVRIANYEIQVTSPSFQHNYRADNASIDIDSLIPDTYSIAVRSVGKAGQVSAWVSTADTVVDGKADPPVAPLGMTAVGGTRRVSVSWLAVARRDIKYYEVQRAPDVSGAPSTFATLAYVQGTSLLDANSPVLMPNTSWWYQVRAVTTTDVNGDFSTQVKGTTTLLIVDDLADGIINAAKFAQTIKPVGLSVGLPGTALEGDITFNETDGHLYKWTGGAWSPMIDLATITGIVSDAQIAAVAAGKITGQLTSAQILSLTAAQLSTPITASNLAAGSITTAALAVGSASNLCWNACLPQTADGWSFGVSVGTLTAGAWLSASWSPLNLGAGFITTSVNLATDASQTMGAYWDPTGTTGGADAGIAWLPGQAIECQAMVQTQRCCAHVQIDFYNASGTYLSSLVGNRVTGVPANDRTLGTYLHSYVLGVAPAGTARARGLIVGYNDGGGDIQAQSAPPYLFWTEFAIGASVPNATAPAPWVNGGVATIAGGMIKAASIQGAQIAALAIQAANIAASAITAGKLAAGAVTAGTLAANAVTAGTIAAGAISASEIAAGVIHASMLASDFQLTNSAQIGTAVIGTAQIGALQVGTSNIGNSAVTNAFATNIPGTGGSMNVFTDGAGEPIFLWWSVPVAGEVDGSGNYLSTVLTISAGGSTIQSLSQVTDGHVWMGNTVLNFSTSGWQTVTVNVGTYGSLYNGTLSALTIKK